MFRQLEIIARIIDDRGTRRPKDHPGWFLLSQVIYPLITAWFQRVRFPNMERSFYADDNCKGCRTCERVCLSAKIKIENRRRYGNPTSVVRFAMPACTFVLHRQFKLLGERPLTKEGTIIHP